MIDDFIQNGIISAQSAHALRDKPNIKFLDTTFVLPGSNENIQTNYKKKHIPGALFFDLSATSDQDSTLPYMLPCTKTAETAMQNLGIHNDDTLILYGQHGMIMGPARVWWMLKGFGHKAVIVLDGGLPAWKKAEYKTESGEEKPRQKSSYSACHFDKRSVLNMHEMINISETKLCPILDARPPARYNGSISEPRAQMRSGHIPNSINIPASSLLDDHHCFKPKEDLRALFENIEQSKRVTLTCGSGITACALALALYYLGHKNIAVYDGSWSEWGHENSPTIIV